MSKLVYGLYEPDTDEPVAVVLVEEYADIWAEKYDLVVEEFEVDDEYQPLIHEVLN